MRISTQMLFQQGLNGMLEQQARSAKTLEQLATGQRVNRVSDDPAAAARIQELDRAVSQQTTFLDNIGRTRQRLSTEEGSLESAGTVIRRVRELAVQAASDTTGSEGRRLIAVELRQRAEELVDIGNSQSGEGEFIFAGAQSQTRPFVPDVGGIRYDGDSVRRGQVIGPGTTMAEGDTGDDLFMRIRNGDGVVAAGSVTGNTGTGVIRADGSDSGVYDGTNFTIRFTDPENYEIRNAANTVVDTGAYQPGGVVSHNGTQLVITGAPAAGDEFAVTPARYESAFATISNLADALEQSANSDVARTSQRQAIDDALAQLDRNETRLLEVRASVGARLNTLDNVQESQESLRFSLETLVSDVRDLNYPEAISRLQQELFTLQASQQAFTRIQGNSLFRFL
ncbi:flagellar hook-associated protein FlgL [Chromatocurvus halotolerans]|uniref:Flagellar hook-associated protein 3 FlgL n=1 Tax=Chromatocurvus halotolerans TaxID=1132028 RepID=A0A4R2KS68_9GAMM|nr:flagellar hook-associated protein FlgL [Chromatocurvus halotolerans]TCO76613.1 flagellar hook-associated protein 3 FlgL [Chromatocurvus halotolerans]